MTNDEREAMIEKAAKAVEKVPYHVWHDVTREGAREIAEAALTVFEQAYTPTDDEREVTEGALWGVVERLSLPLTGVEVQALAESVARRIQR